MSTMVHFEQRKPVTPYICSTPLDFVEERQYLSEAVFPKLNELCKSRGAYFHPCDLHWKPGDTKTEEGLLLKTSLDATKQCSPFFLGLLGETYGPYRDEGQARLGVPKNNGQLDISQEFDWLDKNLVLAGSGGHSWVLQEGNQYKSITELEVTQGAIFSQSPHTTFYYRRSDHLDSKLLPGSDHTPGKHPDVSVYSSESEQAKLKVHDLRQRLVNQGVSVQYFSTLEELGTLVLEDWTAIIDLCLPPLLHDVQLMDTFDYQEWLDQQIFTNRCCELFVSTPDVEATVKQLTEFALTCTRETATLTEPDVLPTSAWSQDNHIWTSFTPQNEQTPDGRNSSVMLMDGDRGTGKSVLVAHWLNAFRADNPDICVISHFVSASCRSQDVVYFLKYSTRKLRQQFLLSEVYDPHNLCASIESHTDPADDTLLSLSEAFAAALSLGPCVIVLDGANELNSHKQCDWLPACLPTTCRVIVTSTSSDVSRHCLSQRSDVTVLDLPVSLKYPSTTVAMIKKHFPTLSDLIGERAMTRLAQLKLMQTALGSKMIGCKLLCFSGYSNVNAFMEEYAEVWSLRDFWTMCVQSWVQEYSWTLTDTPAGLGLVDGGFCYTGWVIDCLCLIALSRNGLTQDQILSLLKMIGYDGDLEVTSYEWMQFRLAASATLQEVGDGRLVLGHRYIQEIAEYLLFGNITASSHNPADILRTAGTTRRHLYHTYLARYFSQQLLNVQVLQELPWHLMFSGDVINLVNCLTDWNVLLKLMSADSDFWLPDLKLYWSVCQVKGHRPEIEYLKLLHDVGVVDVNDVQFPDNVFVTQSRPDQQPVLTTRQHEGDAPEVPFLGWFLAKFLERIHQGETSKIISSSLIDYIQQKSPQTTEAYILLSRCHHLVGQFHETSGDLDTADKEYKLALRAVMAAIDLDDEMIYEKSTQYVKGLLLNCHGNIRILKGQNSEAAELLDEAADCVKASSDWLVLESAICYNLGLVCVNQCNYLQAEVHLRESARLRRRWFGSCHPLVTDVLLALAKLFAEPRNTRGQDLAGAKNLYKRALHAREKWFGAASHLPVASVLYELGTLLAEETSRLAKLEAQDCLRQSLDIRTTSLGSRHPLITSTQQKLTQVNVALQLKNYEFGSVRFDLASSARTSRKPASAVTLPERGRLRLFKKDQRPATAYSEGQERSVWPQSHDGPFKEGRPDSIVSTMLGLTSASERLLSAPLTEIPRLLQRKQQSHSCQGWKGHVTPGNKRKEEKDMHIIKGEHECKVDTEHECRGRDCSGNLHQRSREEGQNGRLNEAENVDGVVNPTENVDGVVNPTENVDGVVNPTENVDGVLNPTENVDGVVNPTENVDGVVNPTENVDGVLNPTENVDGVLIASVNENPHTIQNITVDIQRKGEQCNISKEASQEIQGNPSLDSYSEVIWTENLDQEKKTISIHPSCVPQRLLQRYRKCSLADRPQTCISKASRTPSSLHRLWSGRSNITATSASSSGHLSHCSIPGRHDITVGNTRSISGPHSGLASLLGDPPCPRPVSNRIHHMSAWYHVPGRYPTPQQRYPSKRMQRTKASKDIESYIARKVDFKSKQKESDGHEDLTNQSDKENLMFNGTYLLNSGHTAFSNNDNFSVYPRFVLKQDSTKHLMISGLEIARAGHPEQGSAGQSRVVQFKKNNATG